MRNDPILVTGGAGFIGSHLVERLLLSGHEVVVLDDFNDSYDPEAKRNNLARSRKNRRLRIVEGDVRNEELVASLYEKLRFQMTIHLAAMVGGRNSVVYPHLYQEVNGFGTLHILQACRDYECPHLIFGSSAAVYGEGGDEQLSEESPARPVSPYGATKIENEAMCHVYHRLYGLSVTILRFFTVYGPRQRPGMAVPRFARALAGKGPLPMYGDGYTVRDYTYIDDILQGILASMARGYPFAVINLGSGIPVTLEKLVETLCRALDRPVNVEAVEPQPGDPGRVCADISRARELLDFDPATTLEEGLKRFIEWAGL